MTSPANQQRQAALALVAGAEQALHHELIGAVAGGGEETAAENARPEGIGLGEEGHGGREVEVEQLEFTRLAGHRRHVFPPAGNLAEDDEEADAAAPAT